MLDKCLSLESSVDLLNRKEPANSENKSNKTCQMAINLLWLSVTGISDRKEGRGNGVAETLSYYG